MVAPRIWQCIVEKCTKREKIHQNEEKYAKTREEMSQKRETKSTKKNNEKSAFNFSRSYGSRLYTAKLIYKNTQP